MFNNKQVLVRARVWTGGQDADFGAGAPAPTPVADKKTLPKRMMTIDIRTVVYLNNIRFKWTVFASTYAYV